MAVYKNGIEYDMSYQVQQSECPTVPNGLDAINDESKHIKIDNEWLQHLTVKNASIPIGGPSVVWGERINEVYVEPTDLPVTLQAYPLNCEQVYIHNMCRWASSGGNTVELYGKYFMFRDDNENAEGPTAEAANRNLYSIWCPNGNVQTYTEGNYGQTNDVLIYCGQDITVNNCYTSTSDQVLYYNSDAVLTQSFTDAGFNGTVIDFNKAETEWLENYFNIEQDGTTLNWYEDTLTNEYGKYIRLKKNGTILTEQIYWKDEDIVEEIGMNLTDTAVTKTGSITVGDITKTYSVTQKPVERTMKARMYFNPVEQDGHLFNNFCILPFAPSCCASYSQASLVNAIKRIRYKAAESTTWTNVPVPTLSELRQKAINIGNENCWLADVYTIEVNTAGYYDIEWTWIPEIVRQTVAGWDDSQNQIMFSNSKYYYDFENHYYEGKWNEDMWLENTPFIASIDFGSQYINAENDVPWSEQFIMYNWDDNPRMETLSLGPCENTPEGKCMFQSMMSRGLKYLVYNNLNRGNGHYNWINCDNWNGTYSNEGILFYNCPKRSRFDDWFLGCNAVPHVIYLHPDIYAMENHGFNNEVGGWEYWRYQDAGSPELRELPTNWRTLVPNYLGE